MTRLFALVLVFGLTVFAVIGEPVTHANTAVAISDERAENVHPANGTNSPVRTFGNTTVTFQDGVGGYTGTRDTYTYQVSPATVRGAENLIIQDRNPSSIPEDERTSLLRFDISTIPANSTIVSAQLDFYVDSEGQGFNMFRMKVPWNEATASYSSIGNRHFIPEGIDAEMAVSAFWPGVDGYTGPITVTVPPSQISDWVNGVMVNNGWLMTSAHLDDGVQLRSSEHATVANRPKLTVVYNETPPNFAPASPVVVSPLDNATDVSTSPNLEVSVADPNTDAMTVAYYGRPVTPPSTGEDFTIIAMPDTQHYVDNGGANAANFYAQTQWIVANKDALNIKFVTGLGDITENGNTFDSEWQIANTAYTTIEDPVTTNLVDGIPYGLAVGNHDQSPNGGGDTASTTKYNQYFGTSRFSGRSYYGGQHGTNNDNHYQLFSGGGMDFIIIHLEYDTTPLPAVLTWADGLLQTYSDRRAIVTTHWMVGMGHPAPFGAQGAAIYNELKDRPNLFMLLGGHVHAEGRRQDTFEGRTVWSLLSDYQSRPNGGNGLLRIMTFSPANNTISVKTYSPSLAQFETDFDSQFTLSYDMSGAPPFQLIGTNTNVPSGTNTSINWPGLAVGTEYEWYATVSDGNITTTGPVSSFTTSATTPTATATFTPTNTSTNTATPTFTPTFTPTHTATNTATNTPTDEPTHTPTNTPTGTPTSTATNTATWTPTPSVGNYPATTVNLSENVTITPDTAPKNTTSMIVSTSTSFVGELTADPITGVVRLTNAHHANILPSTYTVTVYEYGTGGTATTNFPLTVTNGTICNGNPEFTSEPDVVVGGNPRRIAIGDFNGDGIQDFAVPNYEAANVSIRLGDGNGGFTSPAVSQITVGSGPFAVAIGDFNGDGTQDFAAANASSGNVSIRLGNGSGGFTSPAVPEVSVGSIAQPISVAIADFNGDGMEDFATSNRDLNTVSIRLGNGSGGFTSPPVPEVAVGASPSGIAIGDFNNDGFPDFVVANSNSGQSSGTVSIRLGNGSGGFTSPPTPEVMVGHSPSSVAIGDFNGDGTQDFAVANAGSNFPGISIRLGNGSGEFTSPAIPEVMVGFNIGSVAIGDFNNDGLQDIAAGGSNNISIRLGNGNGGFTSPPVSEVAIGGQPFSVAIGDFNSDGIQDFAVANFPNSVSIRLGTCVATTPTDTPTPTATTTDTPTNTPTNTPTPLRMITGTVTYGNAVGAPNPRFVSNVAINGVGSPNVSATTDFPNGSYSLAGFGTGPYTVTPSKTGGQNTAVNSFDAARIAQYVSSLTTFSPVQQSVADVSGNGGVSSFDAALVAGYAVGNDGGSSGSWRFNPVSRTYPSITTDIIGEDYSALLMGEVSGNWQNTAGRSAAEPRDSFEDQPEKQSFSAHRTAQPQEVEPMSVALPQLVIWSDSEVVIPVVVDGAANNGIISYEFDLRYDPKVLQPLPDVIHVAGTVSRGLSVVVNANETGLLRVAVYCAMPIEENGLLMNLKFATVGASGSVSPISFERMIFNDGEPSVALINGEIKFF